MRHLSRLTAFVAVASLLVACGDDGGSDPQPTTAETSAGEATFPITVGSGDARVEIPAQPERIVSLSPTATEMLFAIDAGDQVVAADSYSTYPDDAPATDLSSFEPNVEAVIGYDPDLVVASTDPGQLVSSLEQVGVPTLMVPAAASLDDTYTQIEQLGAATGHVGEAAELIASMQADIEALVADVPDGEPLTYFHELDPNLYTITSATFLGELYELAGMKSIADEAPGAAGNDYPQLSPEFVVSADPDVIFFADGGDGGVTADDIAGRPGWDQLTAVREGHVVEVRQDIASRWGPRVVDYLEVIVDARAAVKSVG